MARSSAVGVGRTTLEVFAQGAALQAVFKAGAGHLYLADASLHGPLDEGIVGRQVVFEMKQALIVGQTWPGQVNQGIDALAQRRDVQLRVVDVGSDEFDLAEPGQGLRRLGPSRHCPYLTATRQQCGDQMLAYKSAGARDQYLQPAHRMVNSGTAMTKRPPHSRTSACCSLTSASRFHGNTRT